MKKQMKILILANSDVGLYRFRKELLEAMIADGHQVYISIPPGDRVEDLKAIGCTYIETAVDRRGMNPVTDAKLFFIYKSVIRAIEPDLVITYTIKPNVYGGFAARLSHVPYAINVTGLGTAFQKKGFLRKMVVAMYKVACRKAKMVYFENTGNKEVFLQEKIVREDKTCVLNGAGVNLKDFPYRPYPADPGPTRFLFVGRVMREKGINELLKAMERLHNEGQDCVLEIVGGYEEDYLETIRQFEEEGWLKYHGFQPDVRPFTEACHCCVLPSWHEGMSNTNLEAAATGRPIITSNIYGCKEAVLGNESGLLVEAGNWESLYEAMKHFMELTPEQRCAMGKAGRKHMETQFDKKVVVKNFLKRLQIGHL